MDPLTHTLTGACLAQAGVKRWTPLATAALVIGANLPDVDVVAQFVGRDVSLGIRRGWTHGLLAMLVLPVLLTIALSLYDRARRSPASTAPRRLLVVSYLAVLSHPALDWLNTYGVRLLMPFDGRWFYGDTLFILDPWMWLLLGAGVVLATSNTRWRSAAWLALGLATTSLIVSVPLVPGPSRLTWLVGLGALLAVRLRSSATTPRRLARAGLIVAAAYIGLMLVGSARARDLGRRWASTQGLAPTQVMAGPMPTAVSTRDVIIVTPDTYHFLVVDWLSGRLALGAPPTLAVGEHGPVVEAALRAPQVQGTRNWLRFPTYRVEPTSFGYRVTVRDVRFSRIGGPGTVRVELSKDLRVLGPDRPPGAAR